jgi:outer membrane protein assembly factor BamB
MNRVSLLLVLAAAANAENWPAWRGPSGDGISRESGAPLSWSKTENVRWRTALPEPGNSTPVVWGDAVLLTQARKATNERLLLCFDRTTGKQRWQASVPWAAEDPTHPTNPHSSASPATDGDRVFAWFGSAGLFAYDLKTGRQIWKRDLGRQRHTWGYASSPVIDGERVILNFGPGDRAFLVAVRKTDGSTLWQVDIPPGKGNAFANWQAEDMYGSWATPVLSGQSVILSHPRKVVAHDAATGKQQWATEGLGDLVYPSAVAGSDVVLAASGFQGPVIAVRRSDGSLLWRWEKNKGFIGSAVIRDGHAYWVDQGGIAQAVRLSDGAVQWTARLPRAGEDNGVWSSPVLQGDRIYIVNKSGGTVVFQANPSRFEALATNLLDEPTNASIVIAGGDLFVRTHEALWCIKARHTPK